MNDMDILDLAGTVDREVRRHDFKPGHVIPQGDVYLHALSGRTDPASIAEDRAALEARIQKRWSDFRFGNLGERTTNLQLVNGNSLGASHRIAEKDRDAVEILAPVQGAGPLEGPVVIVKGRSVTLEHHEHAYHEIPEGTFQVVYQRDFATEELRRVQD